MKLLEQKQRELEQISNEIQRLSNGNPQQQRKCVRLKEDYERLKQEIQILQENQNKAKQRLEELQKKIKKAEGNDASRKVERKKLEKEYEELRKSLGVGEELKDSVSETDENTSLQADDKDHLYLDEQQTEVKPIQKDQYGIYEQVRAIDIIEKRMLKRKKIESEAEDAFTIRIANMCELEADINNAIKWMSNPIIQKFEEQIKFIRKKSSKDTKMLNLEITKLEKRIDKITERREMCAKVMGEMNLKTKRIIFDLIGYAVFILRNALYIIARIRDLILDYTGKN